MSLYTITPKTLRALVKARQELCAEYRQALAKPKGRQDACELFNGGNAAPAGVVRWLTKPSWSHVVLVNGTTLKCALPIKRMAEYARLCGGTLGLEIIPDLAPGFYCAPRYGTAIERDTARQVLGIKLVRTMNSAVIFYGYPPEVQQPFATQFLGEAITLTAPAHGGEFVL